MEINGPLWKVILSVIWNVIAYPFRKLTGRSTDPRDH